MSQLKGQTLPMSQLKDQTLQVLKISLPKMVKPKQTKVPLCALIGRDFSVVPDSVFLFFENSQFS